MNKRKSQSFGQKIDLIFLILLLAGVVYFIVESILGGLIPMQYILIIAILMLVIFGVLFFTMRYKDSKVTLVRRIISVLLCILLVFGSVFMGRIRKGLSNFSPSQNVSVMNIVVLKNSGYEHIENIKNQKLGYIMKNDALTQYSMNEIHAYSLELNGYATLDEMLTGLDNREVEAMMMSQQDYKMRSNDDDTFNEKYSIIFQIEMKEENENTANVKDITNTPFTVFISGMDDLGVPDYNGLSDVNMLLFVNPNTHHIEMVSIPRDSYVPNSNANNYPDKLTHLGWLGPDTMVNTLEGIFGIEIDYYAKVSFSSLIEIVETLGGVDVDVQLEFTEQNEYREMDGSYFVNTIHLYPGVQTLNGSEALAYARHRHTEGWGDSGRNFAQQQIIQAIVDKTLTLEGVTKVPELLNVASKYVSTNMPTEYINRFVNSQIEKMQPWTFSSTTMLNGAGDMQICASAEGQLLWIYLLNQNDINNVYTQYNAMFEEEVLADFQFDLNNMEQYVDAAPTNPYLVTLQNFDYVMSTYFPSYYGYEPTPEVPETEQPETPETEEPEIPQQPEEVPVEPEQPEEVPQEPEIIEPEETIPSEEGPSAPEGME